MMMRSLRTRVPPVTAQRSPPLSRMTGADSPVIAASSTLAMPSMTSPSAGMMSSASQTTRSPFCNSAAGTFSSCLLRKRRAMVSLRLLRRLSAWALPRPSATASAKLANRTVNQSQTASWKMKLRSLAAPVKMAIVVSAAPIRVTNMTGFLIIRRGSSFLKALIRAGPTMSQSNKEGALRVIQSIELAEVGQEMLDDGPQRQRRQEVQRPDQQHRAQQQDDKGKAGNREGSGAGR